MKEKILTIKKKCSCCRGKKIVIGMGGIKKECENCGGVGYIEEDLKPSQIIASSCKKRGRPPKNRLENGN